MFDINQAQVVFDNFKMGGATDPSFVSPTLDSVADMSTPVNWKTNTIRVNVSHLKKGIYTMIIEGEERIYQEKIIIHPN